MSANSLLFHKTILNPNSDEWVVFVHGAGGSSSIWFKQLKEYKQHFNLLFIDLRGHGRSAPVTIRQLLTKGYTFKDVTQDIIHVLDHLKIRTAHFVGISLGTILIHKLAELAPSRVKSMVLGGAVTRFDYRSNTLVKLGDFFKHVMPYMWLYRLFAFILMPQKGQKESRHMFINDAKKLCQKEFKRWFKLAADVNPLMKYYREHESGKPTLYLMGQNDYMFLRPVRDIVARHQQSHLVEIEDCGHVCNVEQPKQFNQQSIDFIKQHS
ncbi:alpha/beta hydrolase [Thalassotalea sp. HSM 43]|uniref:alpha/beta fold hydrolase n=1 Tax=Thalassotalea sp. HSM 43 TaxID=2552945 RepID=UPI0010812C0C|nr:alpha/beta hydrolase [Thalassotalea sp. HSM 43]QBY03668.1 alpha/beta hydrolase [Thalassotalea sp. HSM 43]